MSYISGNSFFENKHGFPEYDLKKEPVPTLHIDDGRFLVSRDFYRSLVQAIRHDNQFMFDMQVRGFKTNRNVVAEQHRNPSLPARLKRILGFSALEPLDGKISMDVTSNSERLKQMLTTDDSNITPVEKQRIKLAFAEGYLLGNSPNASRSKTTRYLKVAQQVLTIVIFLAIVVSLMASASGSVFR